MQNIRNKWDSLFQKIGITSGSSAEDIRYVGAARGHEVQNIEWPGMTYTRRRSILCISHRQGWPLDTPWPRTAPHPHHGFSSTATRRSSTQDSGRYRTHLSDRTRVATLPPESSIHQHGYRRHPPRGRSHLRGDPARDPRFASPHACLGRRAMRPGTFGVRISFPCPAQHSVATTPLELMSLVLAGGRQTACSSASTSASRPRSRRSRT